MQDEVTVTVVGATGSRVDLALTAERETPVGQVLSALCAAAAPLVGPLAGSGPLLADGRPLVVTGPWADCGIRHGALLSLTPPAPVRPGGLELRVVAGPSAGTVLPLSGVAVVGRELGCDLVLDDAEVSRRHAEIALDASGGVVVHDLDSTNGVAVDRQVVGPNGRPLPVGELVTVGESELAVVPSRTDLAALDQGDGPSLHFLRPPRAAVRPAVLTEVELPVAPVAADRGRLPWITLAVPVALGAVMFAFLPSSPQFLLLMAMSPLMMIGNQVAERRGGRRGHGAAQRKYQDALVTARANLATLRAEDERERRSAAPDPAELLGRATLPSSRLWERRGGDADALSLRLGVADLPARVIPRPPPAADDGNAALPARSVPVVVSLDEVRVLGVAGEPAQSGALTRWLVGQAAVLLAPSDLTVVVLTTADADWSWLRWLPHARGTAAADCRVLVGLDPASWARRVAELRRHLEVSAGARVLLVLDGARRLRHVPGMAGLLAEGPARGLRVVCRDSEERLLPQECTAVASFLNGSRTRLRLRQGDGSVVDEVLADQVPHTWAETVSRGMAGLHDAGDVAAAGGLPDSVRLLDLLDLPPPTAADLAERWAQGPTTSAVIGLGHDGPLRLDLSADGPHALVAGTTGAGKSELLQTLIASLAVANRPDALTFVLVDYKGGAAFRDCARLPHTVGLVTDLDGRLTERALASLSAELRRRERVLADHGVKDLEALLDATRHEPAPPLARLVIVIDEFATLVEELPEFVRGLVGIAQRGRSLGIHLVLATQRPGGVVSPDIRANTNLRICLRVTHAGESSDVVDSPDAALIPARTAGRGLIRTGAGALQSFQAARVGGRAPAPAHIEPPVKVVPAPSLAELAEPAAATTPTGEQDGPSDLSLLVDAACAAFAATDRPAPRRPWLDPLPEIVVLDDVSPGPYDLPLGLVDLPSQQERMSYGLRLAEPGHLLVVGTPRSGRSTVLQTLAGAVARDWSPDDLHVYALDFGNQGLSPLGPLPHCGAVVGRDQPDRLDRLLDRLSEEVRRRHEVLSAHGFADLSEQRRLAPSHERLPWLLLLLDRWEGFVEAHQDVELGRRVDELLRLLREGPSVGLRAVVTADRSGLLGRLPSVMQQRVVLRLADRGDYGLADIPAREAPTAAPPGRGLVRGEGNTRTFHEVQIALLASDPSGPAQVAALADLVSGARARHGDRPLRHRPLRVDPLPTSVSVGEVLRLGPTAAAAAGLWALIGVGGDQLRPVGVDLSEDGPGFLVVGGPRSGRSTTLLTMAESLLQGGRTLCLVTPRRSPITALAGHPGVTACLDATASEDDTRQVLRQAGTNAVVVVDDAEWLTDTAVGMVLEDELRAEPGQGVYVVAAGTSEDLQSTYRGFTLGLRRSRCGLLLNPQSSLDGDLVGARLPRQLSPGRHAGRALLAVRGDLTPVQVARR